MVALKYSVGYAYSILFSYWRKVFSLLLLGAWHVSVAAAIPGMVTFTLMTAEKKAQHNTLYAIYVSTVPKKVLLVLLKSFI